MGIFSRSNQNDDVSGASSMAACEARGGHDQHVHTRDEGTDHECTVVDCSCGWEQVIPGKLF